jgi:hypothetical protein
LLRECFGLASFGLRVVATPEARMVVFLRIEVSCFEEAVKIASVDCRVGADHYS